MNQTYTDKSNDNLGPSDLLEYFWSYFNLQSNHRIQMINFFITIEVVLIGGLFTVSMMEDCPNWIKYIDSLMISFIAITFYGLDYRTRKLLDMCRLKIKSCEEKFITYGPSFYLIGEGLEDTKKSKVTYTNIFRIQYIAIGCLGVVCVVLIHFGCI